MYSRIKQKTPVLPPAFSIAQAAAGTEQAHDDPQYTMPATSCTVAHFTL